MITSETLVKRPRSWIPSAPTLNMRRRLGLPSLPLRVAQKGGPLEDRSNEPFDACMELPGLSPHGGRDIRSRNRQAAVPPLGVPQAVKST